MIVEPNPPDPAFPRLTDRPLPPYRYVPGLNPHPTADPLGHSFGVVEPDCTAEAAELVTDWRRSPHFRYGVDLYNFAFWWEAHETWEAPWRCLPIGRPHRAALQALIQIAAAMLNLHLRRTRGVEALIERIERRLDAARGLGTAVFGVPLNAWWRDTVRPFLAGRSSNYPHLRPADP